MKADSTHCASPADAVSELTDRATIDSTERCKPHHLDKGRSGGGRGRSRQKDKDKRGTAPAISPRQVCKFCRGQDRRHRYKDVKLLGPFVPGRGKICRGGFRHLRNTSAQAADAISARQIALIALRIEVRLLSAPSSRTPKPGFCRAPISWLMLVLQ